MKCVKVSHKSVSAGDNGQLVVSSKLDNESHVQHRRMVFVLNLPHRCCRPQWTRALQTTLTSNHDSTINPDEIAHFSRLSSLWWDEQGEFKFLHTMNPVRMQFVRQKVLEIAREEQREKNPVAALDGLDVLDVGCGGGLLSEVSAHHLIC